MEENICGWLLKHEEKIFYRSSGNVQLKIKFYSYPDYRQIVNIKQMPDNFRRIKKDKNSFFIFNKIVTQKGVLNINRVFEIFPVPQYMDPAMDWGDVSDIADDLRIKYRENTKYWPLKSTQLKEITFYDWFKENDIKKWIFSAMEFLRRRIFPERQDKRLGAENAYVLRKGDCDEFTDLFVSMARMRGIPARRVTGLFIREKPEPHAWSEIYLPSGEWIIADLALGNIGSYTPDYVVLKIEEFNPAISDYQFSWKGGHLKYRIEKELPEAIPIFCR